MPRCMNFLSRIFSSSPFYIIKFRRDISINRKIKYFFRAVLQMCSSIVDVQFFIYRIPLFFSSSESPLKTLLQRMAVCHDYVFMLLPIHFYSSLPIRDDSREGKKGMLNFFLDDSFSWNLIKQFESCLMDYSLSNQETLEYIVQQ